ncbi:unnamed protein product [Adineta ricciae]|uniref:Uncharacterized protein n=1 Tax=Adineta ricciae TaxID=249248 RepID=A0A815KH38_ADIRI|nr:unnamed protein product [Adineta ricciae]CAF1459806.1 unnamed protein product [Adineta ricciae]
MNSTLSSSRPIAKNPPKQLEITNITQLTNVSTTRKSKCSISRCMCIQLLILLALIALAALVIPIVVIVLDATSSTPCAASYSDTFTYLVVPTTAQCTTWQTFTSSLNCKSYSKMHIYGSNDATGVTITDSFLVTELAAALKYNGTITINSNGAVWSINTCWGGFSINSNGVCSCNAGYAIRPCVGNAYWGGISGTTCNSQSQTLSLYFE